MANASYCDWLRPLFPEVPPGCRVRKIPDDGRSSASEAVASQQRGWPRGFRHGRKAVRCGDLLRNVTPENPLRTPPLSCYLAKIGTCGFPASGREYIARGVFARPSTRKANEHDPASLSSTATCCLPSSGPEALMRSPHASPRRSMHDPVYGFRRTPIPRTPVNKGKKKGRGILAPALLGISSSYYLGSLVTFTLSTEARKGP